MFKNRGLWALARFEAESAIITADEIGCDKESGGLRINLIVTLLKSGPLSKIPALLDEAQALVARAGNSLWSALVHLLRARYLVLTHHPAQALEILTPILATTREQRFSREEAICLEYMGDCHLLQKEFRQALEHYNAALKIAEATAPKGDLIPELGHRIAETLVNLGDPNAQGTRDDEVVSRAGPARGSRHRGSLRRVRDASRARDGQLGSG